MAITQSNLIKFTDGTIPVIVIDTIGAATVVPVSLFPDWVNDAGIQAFGGAAVISIFDDGLAEGSTGKVSAVTQQTIATVGGITVPNPQANETYAVRIRLRSAVADPNYVDRVVRFRVTTPLMVPFTTTEYGTDQEPAISLIGGEIQFDATAGVFPAGEIRLQDGRGGIVLPSMAATNWGLAAKSFVTELGARRKKTLITLDFEPAGTAEGYMRLTYQVAFNAVTGDPTFTSYRRFDFSNWGYFSGSDMSFVDASINMVAGTATINFLRGLYAYGPRFESVWVIGRNGTMPIDPQAIMVGQTIDISQVIDFTARSHLTLTGLADKFVTVVVQTPTQNIMHEIPLRLSGYHDFVAQDGVTNYYTAAMGAALPANPPAFFRYLFYPYLEMPNFTQFYDPNDTFLAGVGTLSYPRVQNIQIFAENAAVASQTYSDVIALHNAMASISMPTLGVTRHVLDVRNFSTPIPQGTAFLTVTMDIDDGTTVSPITAYYSLNEDGQPQSWKLPSNLAAPVDAPVPSYDPAIGDLTIEIAVGSVINPAALLRGDLSAASITLTVPGTTIIPAAVIADVISPLAEIIEIEFSNATGTFKRRLGVVNETYTLITGNIANKISAWFTGTSLVLVDVSQIDLNADGNREITVIGDGPAVLIPDAQSSSVEFLNFQQASPLGVRTDVGQTHVDLVYLSAGIEHRLRVYSNFFDARSANPRTLLNTPRPMWGSTGTEYEYTAFAAPMVKYDLSARTIELESDGRSYNFRAWRVENLSNAEKVDFIGSPTQGRVYQVGGVLRDAVSGSKIMFVAQHRNGTQRVFTGEIRPKANGFQRLVEVRLTPNIG